MAVMLFANNGKHILKLITITDQWLLPITWCVGPRKACGKAVGPCFWLLRDPSSFL